MVKSIVILLETVTMKIPAVYSDGSFKTFNDSETTAQKLVDSGVVNTFAFGPTLVENGKVAVSENEEVGQDMADNPRTAIVVNEESDRSVHYIVIVSDGRTSESSGLTLYEMAELMKSYGVMTGYNLDVGDSSTMYSNGQVINKQPTNGNKISERAVSDIVSSVTKKSASEHFFTTYIGLTIFSLVFTFVYELFSYYDLSANRTGNVLGEKSCLEILIKFSNRGCIKCLFS